MKKDSKNKKTIYKITKRSFDIIFSLIGLIILLIITLLIYMLNKILKDKGPVFYKQDRIGKNGKIFKIYKFRSMCINADEMIKEDNIKKYFSENQIKEWEDKVKIKNDPRITKLGKILRKTNIDELPQIINVLKGDLSVIGPRPIIEEELER